MPKSSGGCTEILNEIISRYSRIVYEKTAEPEITKEGQEEKIETESDFWSWFCESMKDKKFKSCFEDSERTDYYGSLSTIREEHKKRCK